MEKEIRDMAETRTEHYLKYLCEHGKYKYQCRECKGSQICPHNKRKPQCKECAGSQICLHSRKKQTCKKCSDPITVNIEQWIFNSRQYDKMRNIYDADRFIDKCFLKGLIEDYKQCYYGDCEVNLQYTEYQDDLASIERLQTGSVARLLSPPSYSPGAKRYLNFANGDNLTSSKPTGLL